ncbi:hypothetical protein ACFY3N_06460 [Streptomyces sp. NPDC000348]|uniref:hypothetical protein n=1 Tax=Streptomyces sp. NPDC000348 TaxID=3364538 RepID=UPI0036AB4724
MRTPTGERPTGPFTPLGFPLVPPRRTAGHHPGPVQDARRDPGVSPADRREASGRRPAVTRSPRSRPALSRYRSVLGGPESRTPRRVGAPECEAWR